MGIIIRQSIKGSLASYIGIVLGTFMNLWLFTELLQPEEYGITRILISIALIMVQLSQVGMTSTLVRFYPKFKNDSSQLKSFLAIAFVTPLLGFFVCALAFILFNRHIVGYYQENSPQIENYIYLSLIIGVSYTFFYLFESYARTQLRITVPSLIIDVFLRLGIIALLVVYYFQLMDFDGFIVVFSCVYLLATITQIGYSFYLKRPQVSFSISKLKALPLRSIFSFSSLVMLGGSAGILVQNIDLLMVSQLGLDKTAIYSVAFFIGTFIEVPKRALFKISGPIIADAWKRNDLDHIQKLYKDSAINLFTIGVLLLGLIELSIDYLFPLIPRSEIYSQGKWVVLFIGLARIMDMGSGINSEIIRNSDKYQFDFITIALLVILTIIFNYFFIDMWGIEGAAFATFLSVTIYNLSKYIFLWVTYKIQPFSSAHLKVLMLIGVLFMGCHYLIPEISFNGNFVDNFLQIGINSFVLSSLFLVGIYKLNVSLDMNNLIGGILKKIKK